MYVIGEGGMCIKVGRLATGVDAKGPETDKTAMMRYLDHVRQGSLEAAGGQPGVWQCYCRVLEYNVGIPCRVELSMDDCSRFALW